MKNLSKFLFTGLVAAAIMLLSVFVFFSISDVEVSFSTLSAKKTLKSLALPENAMEVSKISVTYLDGTAPETAWQSFSTPDSAEIIRKFFLQKCSENGLSPARDELLATDPTALCEKNLNRNSINFLLRLDCSTNCKVYTQVRIHSF